MTRLKLDFITEGMHFSNSKNFWKTLKELAD